MLERMTIQNFQRHTRLAVDFDPGVTTIVGASDSGKSAVLRALRWVVTNTPGGAAFVTHGARGAVVRLSVDGHTITRRRGKSANTYEIDGQELKAFGTGVPDSIADVFNVGPENFQGQHDAPYWFTDTAGQVSRNLNAVVDLEIIDTAMGAAAGRVRHEASRLEAAEEQQAAAAASVDGLAWVPAAAAALDAAETARDTTKAAEAQAARCFAAWFAASTAQDTATSTAAAATGWAHVARVANTARHAHNGATALEAAIQAATAATAAQVPSGLGPAVQQVGEVVAAASSSGVKAKRLAEVVAALWGTLEAATETETTAAAAQAAVETSIAGGCPLCGK
jgi:hypothetical protein